MILALRKFFRIKLYETKQIGEPRSSIVEKIVRSLVNFVVRQRLYWHSQFHYFAVSAENFLKNIIKYSDVKLTLFLHNLSYFCLLVREAW